MLDLAVMDLARLLGKALPNIIRVLGDVVAQLFELFSQLAFRRRHDGNGSLSRSWYRSRRERSRHRQRRHGKLHRRRVGGVRAAEPRRHDRFFDLGGVADRTGDERALGLLVVGGRIGKPALERMAGLAIEGVADHDGPRTARRWVGSAIGSMSSKRRPLSSEGMRERAAATSAGSTSATMTPGSAPASAMIWPHGSTTSEWPNVSRPFSCLTPWAAANTKHPFSMARARMSTCQCASPVCLVTAPDIAKNDAPASASAR